MTNSVNLDQTTHKVAVWSGISSQTVQLMEDSSQWIPFIVTTEVEQMITWSNHLEAFDFIIGSSPFT